ncbi:hypothetical protein C9374_004987 [Naegleria lovaniensis]|uniref:Uncharacterized protein n=1 Tax=Naegleria lovaniensis TaxID=51637 RepID=A0AA88GMF5_NAELO|nr:uncharacterized protein C9374_004987 [Naegleria lovaniensis]KAG2383020.1 hypothetical protein C9374_004987 [Naegleria lovaniensis]
MKQQQLPPHHDGISSSSMSTHGLRTSGHHTDTHELPAHFRIQYIHKPYRCKKSMTRHLQQPHIFVDNSGEFGKLMKACHPQHQKSIQSKPPQTSVSRRRKKSLGCIDYFKGIEYEPISDQRFSNLTLMAMNLFPTSHSQSPPSVHTDHHVASVMSSSFHPDHSTPSSPSTSIHTDDSLCSSVSACVGSSSGVSSMSNLGPATISVDGRAVERQSLEKYSFPPKHQRVVRTSISIHELLN